MAVYPAVARLAGYTFRVGSTPDLARDGKQVHATVWGPGDTSLPSEVTAYKNRYDPGMTWIVCYSGDTPVGVMGLLDMRVGSVSLDLHNCLPPPSLDLATTREICRLSILPGHRGGAQLVMVGLLREMLQWSKANGIATLFSGSKESLFRVYRRFNPSARLIVAPPAGAEDPIQAQHYEALRRVAAKEGVLYTFDVDAASPWSVFSRFLTGRLRRSER
jgi:hypothetical protein